MAIIRMKSVSPVLTPGEIDELESAEKLPVQLDNDSPKMSAEMLKQFTRMNNFTLYAHKRKEATYGKPQTNCNTKT